MKTNDIEGFRYGDMKAALVDIEYGVTVTATFRIFLPPTAMDDRIYEECERIPIDIMFRYLVAIHHNLTVTDVDARVIMLLEEEDSDGIVPPQEKYALFATCRCFYSPTYLESVAQSTKLFAASTDDIELIHTSTYIKTMPVFVSKETETTYNGIFHITTALCREVPPPIHMSRLRPYGLEINIRCLNHGALETMGLKYDIYEHNTIYTIINDAIKEAGGMLTTWMIYETTEGFKAFKDMTSHISYHFIHHAEQGENRSKKQLTVNVILIPDGLFGLKFKYSGVNELAVVPFDMDQKRLVQYQDFNWAMPSVTFDPIMRRMEVMNSYLLSTVDYTYVSQCTSCSRVAYDDVMHFVFKYEPAVICWPTGFLDGPSEHVNRVSNNSLCDYLISRSLQGFDVAFPIGGQNPRRGVIFYVRFPEALGINSMRQAFPLTRNVPIYSRVISVTNGYIVMQYCVDGMYDQDTLGCGDLDKYFPADWFPTVNDDTMMQSRGDLINWTELSDKMREDTVKLLLLLVRYMFSFQINEIPIMHALGVTTHMEVLHSWMNCVGLPYFWRPYMDEALKAMGLDDTPAAMPPKKGLLSKFFGK